jgi:hypothetical protein
MNFFEHVEVLLGVEAIAFFVFHGFDLGEILLPKSQSTGWNANDGGGFANFDVLFCGVFHVDVTKVMGLWFVINRNGWLLAEKVQSFFDIAHR